VHLVGFIMKIRHDQWAHKRLKKTSNTYYITYVNFGRGLERNSMTSLWLTIYNELNFTLIFIFWQQFLQEQNPAENYGYLYIYSVKLFK